MKCAGLLIGVGAFAGLAGAGVASQGAVSHGDRWLASTTIDISGLSAYGGLGDDESQVLDVFTYQWSDIHGFGWNLELETLGASWISDLWFQFRSNNGEVFDLQLWDEDGPGSLSVYQPNIDLWGGYGVHFLQGASGTFQLEFFDTFIDNGGAGEAVLLEGSELYIQYWIPSSGTLALFGVGGLMAARRRR